MTVRRSARAVTAALVVCSALVSGPAAIASVAGRPDHIGLASGGRPPTYSGASAPVLTLAAAPPQVATGRSTILTGRVTDSETGSPIRGASIRLEAMTSSGTFVELAAMTSDTDGRVSSVQTPQSTTGYRLHMDGPDLSEGRVSAVVQVPVRRLTAVFDHPGVRVRREVAVRGVLAAAAGSRLRLEHRVGGSWRTVDRTRTAADGSYDLTVRPTRPGFSRWRIVRPAVPSSPQIIGWLPRLDAYRLHTYNVTTRGEVRSGLAEFRSVVAATYADPRGWLRAHHRFREVRRGGPSDFTVVLAEASTLTTFSSSCSASYSCRVGRSVVINKKRWRHGSPYFPGDLTTYRRMLVDHETGHWLGLGHAYCPRHGALAPVMQQQSKGMQGCRVNPWPRPREIRAVS